MKSLLILPLAMLLSIGASAATIDGKSNKSLKNRKKLEIEQLFNSASHKLNIEVPVHGGKAIALVHIDALGNAKVLESNASNEELKKYVEKQVELKNFRSFKNETIKVVIDYRK